MGNFRDDRRGGDFRGGRSSFGGSRGFDRGRDRGGDRGNRPLFDAVCSNCGKPCQVPFRPTNGKPVYCSDCFEKMGNRGDSRRSPAPSFDQNKAQFDALNAKMDKILSLLEPKTEVFEVKTEPASVKDSGETKEVKAPKAKKTVKKTTKVKKV